MLSRSSPGRSWRMDAIRPHPVWRPRYHLTCLALAGVVAFGGHAGLLLDALGAEGGSAATGHAEVIAQEVVDLEDGSLAWSVATVEAGERPTPLASDGAPGFVLGAEGSVLLDDGAGARTRLSGGEALAMQPADELKARSADEAPASLSLLTLERAAADGVDDAVQAPQAFASPGGSRDVELWRDVLAEGETSHLPGGDAPTFVLVTGGAITIAADEADGRPLQAGETALLTGSFTLTGEAAEASSFVAAVIGPDVDGAQPNGKPIGSSPPTAPVQPTNPSQTDDSTPTPTATPTEVPPTPTPSGNGPDDDPDADELVNRDEATYGTDPRNPDTDGDFFADGSEVHDLGTNPTLADTDGDGLTDYEELNGFIGDPTIGRLDPNNPDTDGDSFTDGDEVNVYGTNPAKADTDGDGLSDGYELVALGTSPKNADTDGDWLTDGDEINRYFSDPTKSDTDGDGYSDDTEVDYATDPINPSSHP